jgi:hypothetical protein
MKRSFLLLIAVVMLLVLVTATGKMPGTGAGPVPFFYFLILLVSIVSLMTGTLRVISGKRSLLSFIFIFLSVIVFALAYYLVIQ